jgi:hypothetical protein
MGVREIQDMTLNMGRRTAIVEALFEERTSKFHHWRAGELASAFRVTAIPVEPVPDPGRIFGRPEFFPPVRRFVAQVGTQSAERMFGLSIIKMDSWTFGTGDLRKHAIGQIKS